MGFFNRNRYFCVVKDKSYGKSINIRKINRLYKYAYI